jgi:hypothetical protein
MVLTKSNQLAWTYKHLNEVDPQRLNGATLGSFRTELLKQYRPLHVMRDLGFGTRHRELDHPHDPPVVVTHSTAAYYEKEGVLYVNGFHTPFSSEAGQATEFLRNWPDCGRTNSGSFATLAAMRPCKIAGVEAFMHNDVMNNTEPPQERIGR